MSASPHNTYKSSVERTRQRHFVLVRSRHSSAGFSMIEVLVATAILTVGLLSLAMLNTRLMVGGRSSKFMSQASVLASEKLEDLNRWDSDDPQICNPTGSAVVGSLTADITQTTTCPGGASASVDYDDDVYLSFLNNTDCPSGTDGCVAETVSSLDGGGNKVYTTTYHAPDGTITTVNSNSAPAGATFHRRWTIEANQPTAGVRRVTVLVTLLDASVRPPVNFEMSLVRP